MKKRHECLRSGYRAKLGASRGAMAGKVLVEAPRGTSERTLSGERIGPLPFDDHCYTTYFAEFPLGRFDSHTRTVHRVSPVLAFYRTELGEGEPPPSRAPHPRNPVNYHPGLNCQILCPAGHA